MLKGRQLSKIVLLKSFGEILQNLYYFFSYKSFKVYSKCGEVIVTDAFLLFFISLYTWQFLSIYWRKPLLGCLRTNVFRHMMFIEYFRIHCHDLVLI